MWHARTKIDLIIEVWEKLDCESVGAAEIRAIETVVKEEYGDAAVDSPMVIARLLADEGADLRHSEIMSLYVERAADRPYDAAFRNVIKIDDLQSAERSIRDLENLRRKYLAENDKEGVSHIYEIARQARQDAADLYENTFADARVRELNAEVRQWLVIWIQTPEVFNDWLDLRKRSPEFAAKFGSYLTD
jgi:hypothetical protein